MLDVIVPVFRGKRETQRCLESVLRSRQTADYELVVIDDATPEPELATYLDELASQSLISLFRNSRNLGYVGSVNRGMAAHPGRDVVLLNSDTEVANDWLDRLRRAAYGEPDIGTVTPFSNHATICSYPFDGWQGGVPGTLGLAALDRVIASSNGGRRVELPTAVGFCMFIRRACIEAVGLFDEQRFGRGYGEENDFSLRAAAAGWRNMLAADVFVFHAGSVSFGAERGARQHAAMKALLAIHPDYLERLGEFSARDPVQPLREAIDLARMAFSEDERLQVKRERMAARRGTSRTVTQLHFTHSWDGGTNRWIADFCKYDGERRNLVLRSVSDRNVTAWRLELLDPALDDFPLLSWDLEQPVRATAISHIEYQTILAEVIDAFDVNALIVSSLIGHALDAFDTDLPTVVVLHDLYPFCPALFAYFDGPCTGCAPNALKSCMRRNPYNAFWHNTSAADWLRLRETFRQRLALPSVSLAAPTHSAWRRWVTLYPPIADRACRIIAHGMGAEALPAAPRTNSIGRRAGAKLRLVVPGRLLPHKGLDLFAEALPGMLPHAEILLLGCGRYGRPFENTPGVEIVRTYRREELGGHVEAFGPDAALMLSVVPESFSYTLSEMLALGLPVIATNLGAFAERIEPGANGLLVEPSAAALGELVQELAREPGMLDSMRQRLKRGIAWPIGAMIDEYHALLPEGAAARAESRAGERHADVIERWLLDGARERQQLVAENRQLRQELEQREARASALEAALGNLDSRCAELAGQVAYVQAEKTAILGSRSWRLAAPLRGLADALRGIGRLGTAGAAGSVREMNPTADPTQSAARLPLGFDLLPGKRDLARRLLRESIAVPDASIIAVSLLSDETGRPGSLLAAVAGRILRLRNDIVFVLGEAEAAGRCESETQTALLLATRRLFALPDGLDIGTVLLGADVLLLDHSARIEQFLPLSASGMKLLVFDSGHGGSAQAPMAEMAEIRHVSADEVESVSSILADWFGKPPCGDLDSDEG